jgi:hypothetical protein
MEERMPTRNVLVIALLTTALVGCGAARTTSRVSPNVITREQLAGLEAISAYDAIQRLRPTWLQSRGPTSLAGGPTLPRVHINQSRTGSIDELRTIPVTEVELMEFKSASDATTEYGTGYPGGVIEVATRR